MHPYIFVYINHIEHILLLFVLQFYWLPLQPLEMLEIIDRTSYKINPTQFF